MKRRRVRWSELHNSLWKLSVNQMRARRHFTTWTNFVCVGECSLKPRKWGFALVVNLDEREGPVRNSESYGFRNRLAVLALTAHSFGEFNGIDAEAEGNRPRLQTSRRLCCSVEREISI